jgi:uncharacterized protein YdeI (YjbR/CyaY-like superfamily)
MDCRPARTKNPDLWLESTPEVSRPLCETLREWILTWEPELTESIKWNMLCFSGRKLVCALGGYKRCAGLTFFRGKELAEAAALCEHGAKSAAIMSMRIFSLEALDRGALRRLLRAAVRLDETVPPPRPERAAPRPLPEIPPVLAAAFRRNRSAREFFGALKPTYQREYILWVGMAKRPETQRQRLTETIAALAAGKKWAQRKI